ncbi:hypothetical protein [Paenibacillus sp. Soil522]|uniref:hypothetical protein n=1 Tax=Paenibacillus sp. Soil522 TaxID=1736388 RepID=UPI0006FFAA7C|nr:hypothetical protein [Paenibacillus sp. Soil522]KRE46738.1 hypothetical protein ASG81_10735 [Paenibacillus sp. Soil522]
MKKKGGCKGSKSHGCKSSGSRSDGCKSSGSRSHGSKSSGSRSHGSKGSDCRSDGSKRSEEKSCGKNSHFHCILSDIGVGTANIRIHFDGTVRTGVFLGIVDGCVVINVNGVVSYIKITSITAVDVGCSKEKKTKKKCIPKCRKRRVKNK